MCVCVCVLPRVEYSREGINTRIIQSSSKKLSTPVAVGVNVYKGKLIYMR